MTTTFTTFKLGGVRFIAIPFNGNFHVISDSGENHGSWQKVETFKKWHAEGKLESLGKAELRVYSTRP